MNAQRMPGFDTWLMTDPNEDDGSYDRAVAAIESDDDKLAAIYENANTLADSDAAHDAFVDLCDGAQTLGEMIDAGWAAVEAKHKHQLNWPELARIVQSIRRLAADAAKSYDAELKRQALLDAEEINEPDYY